MGLNLTISSITGQSPYEVYLCQVDGTGCFYINEITSTPYSFIIPPPYDTSTQYMIKIIDDFGCIITGTTSI
jgi:hypothetical protein